MSSGGSSGRASGRGGPKGNRSKAGRGTGAGRGGGRVSGKSNSGVTSQMASMSIQDSTASRSKQSKKRGNGGRRRGGEEKKKSEQNDPPPYSEEDVARMEKEAQEDAAKNEERKRQEAETKRLEQEKKSTEAAKLARERQVAELQTKTQNALELLESLVQTTQQRREARELFAAESLVQARKKFEAGKKSLKSDLKKCTAFVKKVKSGSTWSMRPHELTRDIATLNLSRYVDEVAAAVTESKWKVADLPLVVVLCRAMHERYAEFLSTLIPSLWSTIQGKVTEETAKLRRLYVRLITEFVLNGMGSETKPLVKAVAEAAGGNDGTYSVSDANLVVSFVKAGGFEIIGTKPTSIQNEISFLTREVERFNAQETGESAGDNTTKPSSETPVVISSALHERASEILSHVDEALEARAVGPKVVEVLHAHCLGAYGTLANSLVVTHGKLQKLEKRCEQDRLLSGSLSEAREKGLTDARKLLDSLLKSVEFLADALALPMPELHEEKEDDVGDKGVGLELWTKEEGGEGTADLGPFDDEETRAFYCDIPDLLSTIPPALLGMTPEAIDEKCAENSRKYGARADESQGEMEEADSAEVTPSSEADLEADEVEETTGIEDEGENEGDEDAKDTPHYRLMVLLESELPECSRREQVDEIAEKFCVNHGSSKGARKRLTRTLFMVPRTRLDLLPFYSRLAAIIDRIFADITPPLVQDLEQQFHGQAKFKKNQNVESRLRTARFLGELTKFRIAPPIVSLRCMRRCLDDFSGCNIDVACCLLESCGRYLFRAPHTTARITALMDTITRMSKARNLDERAKALINSAMYSVKPPPAGPRRQAKVYPPLEAYLRNLLLVRLVPEANSIAFVTKQLLRLPWDDPSRQCGSLICKYMMKACRKGRYKAITAVAAVAANLRRSKPEVAARLMDNVLEELRWSLEHPDFRDQQRSITYAKLLGELYCCNVASGQLIFQQLSEFIDIGHEIPVALREASEKIGVEDAGSQGLSNLPVYDSSKKGISRAIQEDEELNDDGSELVEEEPEPLEQIVAVSIHSKYDPRVLTPADPPNAVLRIQLVCTLLESGSKLLVSKRNLFDLEKFLVSFQRYLFTKASLPTEVEFALLDTFDAMDSRWKSAARGDSGMDGKAVIGFPRYTTWLEAHNATVAFEQMDAHTKVKAQVRLQALAGFPRSADATDGITGNESLIDDDVDSAGMSLEDDEESMEDQLSLSATDTLSDEEADDMGESGSMSEEMSQVDEVVSDEESSDGSDETDDDLNSSGEEEMDEDALMRQLEEEAFERELRRMTMEALEKGKTTAGRQVAVVMPSGSQFIPKKAQDPKQDTHGAPMALGGKQGVAFQLLKKGNKGKMEAKTLVVPSDTNLAKVATRQDDEAARERDLLKARVLQYEAESAGQEGTGGNVYLEQSKLQVIRNRPLSMEEIDRNFGSTRGENPGSAGNRPGVSVTGNKPRSQQGSVGRGRGRGRSSGRGRGRSGGGRSLV